MPRGIRRRQDQARGSEVGGLARRGCRNGGEAAGRPEDQWVQVQKGARHAPEFRPADQQRAVVGIPVMRGSAPGALHTQDAVAQGGYRTAEPDPVEARADRELQAGHTDGQLRAGLVPGPRPVAIERLHQALQGRALTADQLAADRPAVAMHPDDGTAVAKMPAQHAGLADHRQRAEAGAGERPVELGEEALEVVHLGGCGPAVADQGTCRAS